METADSPSPPSPNTAQKPEPLSLRLPWEDRALFGFAGAFIETVKLIINEPKEAFGRLQKDGRFVGPLLDGVIVSWVGLVFFYFWILIFGRSARERCFSLARCCSALSRAHRPHEVGLRAKLRRCLARLFSKHSNTSSCKTLLLLEAQ